MLAYNIITDIYYIAKKMPFCLLILIVSFNIALTYKRSKAYLY